MRECAGCAAVRVDNVLGWSQQHTVVMTLAAGAGVFGQLQRLDKRRAENILNVSAFARFICFSAGERCMHVQCTWGASSSPTSTSVQGAGAGACTPPCHYNLALL